MKNICLILVSLFSLAACSEDVFIEAEPQLIVEGWIDDGGFPIVILSESVPVSDKYEDVNWLFFTLSLAALQADSQSVGVPQVFSE